MSGISPPLSWKHLAGALPVGTELGRLDQLPNGQVHMVPGPCPLLLLRSGDAVRAYVNQCPHFGLPLAARQQHLIFVPHVSLTCNVHYARFGWHDGVCDMGDCVGESLIAVPLNVDSAGCIRIADSSDQ